MVSIATVAFGRAQGSVAVSEPCDKGEEEKGERKWRKEKDEDYDKLGRKNGR